MSEREVKPELTSEVVGPYEAWLRSEGGARRLVLELQMKRPPLPLTEQLAHINSELRHRPYTDSAREYLQRQVIALAKHINLSRDS